MSSVTVTASHMDDILGVCITAHKVAGSPRGPVHFTILVDTSGSMAGARMTEVKQTINRLIDLMDSIDSLSIILYHSSATILLNTVKMSEDRAPYHAAVESLHANGGTNLESAFLQIPSLTTPPTAVFLLTDGHINEGQNRPSALISMARAVLPVDTPLHTLGYGPDHNQSMLRDMSVRTHASYTYAESNEIVPIALGNVLGGLTAEVGHSTRLIIPPGYKSLELNSEDSTISIGRLIDEKPHYVIFQKIDSTAALPDIIEFQWKDGAEHVERVAPVATTEPILLTEQVLRATTAKSLSEITDHMIRHEMDAAKTRLEELKTRLDGSPAAARVLIIQLRANVDGMLEDLKTVDAAAAAAAAAGWGAPPPPALARMLSSGASATAYAGNQAGVLSGLRTATGTAFSTPRQAQAIRSLSHAPSSEDPSEE
jgi:hypothetical protein